MNKTKELLLKIKTAIDNGNLQIDSLLADDIGSCFSQEIELSALLYSTEQQKEIRKRTEALITDLRKSVGNKDVFISLLNSMIMSIDLVSETKSWFVNSDYWKRIHGNNDSEINEIIRYIELTGEIDAISNSFVKEYDDFDCQVYFDDSCEMCFVIHNEKKMYFPKDYDANRVKEYYKGIIIEQDKRSPHYYCKEGYNVKAGDIVVDAGVAEGNFSLEIVDKAAHIYLIEADDSWIEALEETFKPYKEKVTIIKGYLCDEMNGDNVSIDRLFFDKKINYIKMDIEGYERMSLLGAENVINQSDDFRCAICSYHHFGDENWIREFLDGMLMDNTTSEGYMVPVWDSRAYHDCEVRRGIVFGKK